MNFFSNISKCLNEFSSIDLKQILDVFDFLTMLGFNFLVNSFAGPSTADDFWLLCCKVLY